MSGCLEFSLSVCICTTNVRILVRRSRIFPPRRREEREEKRFQKLRVLRVFAVDFLGCGWAALCSSVVSFIRVTIRMPRETVLVVDDERLVRWSLQQKLQQWGYNVSTAE